MPGRTRHSSPQPFTDSTPSLPSKSKPPKMKPSLRIHNPTTAIPSGDNYHRGVGFATNPVIGESRPPTPTEERILLNFETHAQNCGRCYNPSKVQQRGEQLCSIGRKLAKELKQYFYRHDGIMFSTLSTPERIVRVELCVEFRNCKSLLKAIARGAGTSGGKSHNVSVPAAKYEHDPYRVEYSPETKPSKKKNLYTIPTPPYTPITPTTPTPAPTPAPTSMPKPSKSKRYSSMLHPAVGEKKQRSKKKRHNRVSVSYDPMIVDWPTFSAESHGHNHDYDYDDNHNHTYDHNHNYKYNLSNGDFDDAYSTHATVGRQEYGDGPVVYAPGRGRSHRGSLYMHDLANLYHSEPYYRVEVREPAWHRKRAARPTSYYV